MALASMSFVLACVVTAVLIAVDNASREVARGRLALVPHRAAAPALLAAVTIAVLIGYNWFGSYPW